MVFSIFGVHRLHIFACAMFPYSSFSNMPSPPNSFIVILNSNTVSAIYLLGRLEVKLKEIKCSLIEKNKNDENVFRKRSLLWGSILLLYAWYLVLWYFFFSVGQVNGKVCNLMQNQATHTEKYAGPFLLKFCRSGELSYLHNFFFLTH